MDKIENSVTHSNVSTIVDKMGKIEQSITSTIDNTVLIGGMTESELIEEVEEQNKRNQEELEAIQQLPATDISKVQERFKSKSPYVEPPRMIDGKPNPRYWLDRDGKQLKELKKAIEDADGIVNFFEQNETVKTGTLSIGYSKPTPPKPILIENLMKKVGVSFETAESGTGKSWLALELALGIASGADSFLCYKILEHGPVLWVDWEQEEDDLLERAKLMKLRDTNSNFQYIIAGGRSFEEILPLIEKKCQGTKFLLIVLDSITSAFAIDENSMRESKKMMKQLKMLKEKYQLAILGIAHTNKNARFSYLHQDLQRGSGATNNLLDGHFQMKISALDPSQVVWKIVKAKHFHRRTKEARLLQFEDMVEGRYHWKDLGITDERIHTPIQETNMGKRTQMDFGNLTAQEQFDTKVAIAKAREQGINERTVYRELDRQVEEGILKKIERGTYTIAAVAVEGSDRINKDIQNIKNSNMVTSTVSGKEITDN